MRLITNTIFILFFLIATNSFGQVISGAARAAASEAAVDPFANVFQKWTPMMQKLFQQVNNGRDYIEYEIGADVGSPYENEQYLPGQVYYDEEHLGDFYYRYNAYNQEIELKSTLLVEEKQKALVKDAKVKLVTKSGTIQFLTAKNDKGKIADSYFKQTYMGEEYALYHKLIIKYTEGKPAANSMVNPIPSRFTNYTTYYYKDNASATIQELPQKKGKFLKLFSDKNGEQLKNYMKSKEFDLESKKDLIALFQFIEKSDL